MGTPGGAPGAPIPGLAPATVMPTFATRVYNDPAKDADRLNYAQILAPFIIDPNNVGNSITPKEIRNHINGGSTAMDSLALVNVYTSCLVNQTMASGTLFTPWMEIC